MNAAEVESCFMYKCKRLPILMIREMNANEQGK